MRPLVEHVHGCDTQHPDAPRLDADILRAVLEKPVLVPASAVGLHRNPVVDEEVEAAGPRDVDLAGDRESRILESASRVRFEARLGTGIAAAQSAARASAHDRPEPFDLARAQALEVRRRLHTREPIGGVETPCRGLERPQNPRLATPRPVDDGAWRQRAEVLAGAHSHVESVGSPPRPRVRNARQQRHAVDPCASRGDEEGFVVEVTARVRAGPQPHDDAVAYRPLDPPRGDAARTQRAGRGDVAEAAEHADIVVGCAVRHGRRRQDPGLRRSPPRWGRGDLDRPRWRIAHAGRDTPMRCPRQRRVEPILRYLPPAPGDVGRADYSGSVVAALYRRYRPETFAELIGQTQVTDPLRTALRTDRVNHAYLFSGPRGCGKTTSARILARCLNCAEGPTDTPCGVCPSCVELSRDGGGSLDVVEIDAASHNGVDDARDLRERAVFAPARDRYKIFILDEAHMVTPQGFNALLKIVEEPPEHVKFIFATTEPEKVIGTIRSRTHHYPFRLVPPAQMLDYVQQLCDSEKVTVEPGVLPLVVRAGGGSVRDTLSLLDQLIAGSEGDTIEYERAVALLGYTHGALLDEVVDAFGARDAAGVFGAIDRVIQTGQDPRRFVEDLLERLRDLIVVAATRDNASAVLRGMPQDQLERMAQQASSFGSAELSRAADVVNAALSEMTGATSPRLHLELMAARILVPESDDTERGALARVERLERRIGVEGVADGGSRPTVPSASAPRDAAPRDSARTSAMPPGASADAGPEASATATATPPDAHAAPAEPSPDSAPEGAAAPAAESRPRVVREASEVTFAQVRDAWPEVLEVIEKAKRTAWMVVVTAKPLEWREGGILVLAFPSQNDVNALKQPSAPGEGVGDYLKRAMVEVLGVEPKLIARVADAPDAAPASSPRTPAASPVPAAAATSGWAVAAIPTGEPAESAESEAPEPDALEASGNSAPADVPEPRDEDAPPADDEPPFDELPPAESGLDEGTASSTPPPAAAASASPTPPTAPPTPSASARPSPTSAAAPQRYGEAVVRDVLKASFIEEQQVAPRVTPRPADE